MPRFTSNVRHFAPAGIVIATVLGLSACKPEDVRTENAPIAVRVTRATLVEYAPRVQLTGEVQAQIQSDLSFRVAGRVTERLVNVGDHVEADQILARLDPQQQGADVTAAEATVAAAEATLRQTSSNFERQKALLAQGYTTRRDYDRVEENYRTAKASLDVARAQLGTVRDQLSFTTLRADAPGVITARSIESGQVVHAGQTVFSVAQDGVRDAVFNVYEQTLSGQEPTNPTIDLWPVSNPALKAAGTLREISPTVDASTGTVKVKIGIVHPQAEMTLGTAVVGEVRFNSQPRVTVPWSALSSENGRPAVWTIDPTSKAASLKPITIESYEAGKIVVREGLRSGELVVTDGTQLLRPNQTVALANGAIS